jgi:hypothetical protein
LSVLRFRDSDSPLVSCGHCFVCPSFYGFWFPFGILWPLLCLSFVLGILIPIWYLVAIALSVLRFTDSDSTFGILWPLLFLSFVLEILMPLWYLVAIALSVLRFRDSDSPLVSCGHYFVCPSLYGFGFPFGIL